MVVVVLVANLRGSFEQVLEDTFKKVAVQKDWQG